MSEVATPTGRPPGETLLFIHIPKAAGGTLRQIIARNFHKSEVLHVHGSDQPVRDLDDAGRRRLKAIMGHWRYGLHELLPQPTTYVTLLREPVDRIVSMYYYILREPRHRLHERVAQGGMELGEYVRLPVGELDNGQTRLISGAQGVPPDACEPEMLERAKANLERDFAVVGLQERFEDSLTLLREVFAWRERPYKKRHVAGSRPSKKEVPRDILAVIEERNRLDQQLYDFAVRLFEAAWAARG